MPCYNSLVYLFFGKNIFYLSFPDHQLIRNIFLTPVSLSTKSLLSSFLVAFLWPWGGPVQYVVYGIYNLNMALVDCVLMQTRKYLLSSLLGLVAEMHIPCPQGICSLIGVPTWNIPVNQTNKHRQKAQQVVKMRDKLVATSKVKAGSPGRQESSWFQKVKRQYPHSIWGV